MGVTCQVKAVLGVGARARGHAALLVVDEGLEVLLASAHGTHCQGAARRQGRWPACAEQLRRSVLQAGAGWRPPHVHGIMPSKSFSDTNNSSAAIGQQQ